MTRLRMLLIGLLLCVPNAALPQRHDISLFVSPVLLESGLMKFLLPRFSLKTGVSIDLKLLETEGVVPPAADVTLTNTEAPESVGQVALVMSGFGQDFYVISAHPADADSDKARNSARFFDWLFSEVGKRTIESFEQDGKQLFVAAAAAVEIEAAIVFSGDQLAGESLAFKVCGRCHVVGEKNRMKGLGSTPSFGLLRTFPDWQRRFEAFFTLNPHPSFTQVTGVTAPFDPARPPPISPIVLSLDQLDDILAFVATIAPANLGAAIDHQ